MGKLDITTRNMSEKFCLKWNEFHSNVSKSFGALRSEEYLHDVTLVSDDQNLVTAHKLVLSASSEYFQSIFKSNKASNPFLCLEGVSSADLNNILDYIYNGEVQIYQEHLDRFLNVAQRFKLEGLLGGEEKVESEDYEEEKTMPDFEPSPRIRTVKKVQQAMPEVAANETTILLNNQIQPIDSNDLSEIDQKLYENMVRNSDGRYSCKICSKANMHRTQMKFHVETHMEGLTFPCNTCGKDFRSRNSLRVHLSTRHKN